jgi:general stress protein YciG
MRASRFSDQSRISGWTWTDPDYQRVKSALSLHPAHHGALRGGCRCRSAEGQFGWLRTETPAISPTTPPRPSRPGGWAGGTRAGGNNPANFANDPSRAADAGRKGGRRQGKANNPANFANDPTKAAEAGRRGGQVSGGGGGAANNPGNFANNRSKAAEAGRKGGKASRRGAAAQG